MVAEPAPAPRVGLRIGRMASTSASGSLRSRRTWLRAAIGVLVVVEAERGLVYVPPSSPCRPAGGVRLWPAARVGRVTFNPGRSSCPRRLALSRAADGRRLLERGVSCRVALVSSPAPGAVIDRLGSRRPCLRVSHHEALRVDDVLERIAAAPATEPALFAPQHRRHAEPPISSTGRSRRRVAPQPGAVVAFVSCCRGGGGGGGGARDKVDRTAFRADAAASTRHAR